MINGGTSENGKKGGKRFIDETDEKESKKAKSEK
jgi:hypothetical protein